MSNNDKDEAPACYLSLPLTGPVLLCFSQRQEKKEHGWAITKCKNAILEISRAIIILKSTNICANHFPLVFLYVAYIKTSECVKFQCNKKIQGSLGLVGGRLGEGGEMEVVGLLGESQMRKSQEDSPRRDRPDSRHKIWKEKKINKIQIQIEILIHTSTNTNIFPEG